MYSSSFSSSDSLGDFYEDDYIDCSDREDSGEDSEEDDHFLCFFDFDVHFDFDLDFDFFLGFLGIGFSLIFSEEVDEEDTSHSGGYYFSLLLLLLLEEITIGGFFTGFQFTSTDEVSLLDKNFDFESSSIGFNPTTFSTSFHLWGLGESSLASYSKPFLNNVNFWSKIGNEETISPLSSLFKISSMNLSKVSLFVIFVRNF